MLSQGMHLIEASLQRRRHLAWSTLIIQLDVLEIADVEFR